MLYKDGLHHRILRLDAVSRNHVDFLEQVMLQKIRRLTKFSSQYEKEFTAAIMGHSQNMVQNERQNKQKELNKLLARDKELDTLFNRMYEDNISGKIDDVYVQKFNIHYACVGVLEIPVLSKLPDIDVTVNTRQGVNVTYSTKRKMA